MRATSTTTVQAPIDKVWDVLADHEGMSSWGPGITVTITKPGTTERNGLGAVRKVVAPGPAPAIVEEVIGFDPGKRLAYKALSGVPMKNYVGEVLLSEVPGGTRIDYSISADQRIPLVEKGLAKAISFGLLKAFTGAVKKA